MTRYIAYLTIADTCPALESLEVGTISYRQFKELETLTTIERN